jgi:D-3-phosphoglycerate dehydrogenase
MPCIFLTHPPLALRNYYGDKALAGLREIAEVRLNPLERELGMAEVAQQARGCELVISYRQTPGPAELFGMLPDALAFMRCAIDIRNIDVEAASRHGILVTQASAGFIASVAEWVVGVMVDLSRDISLAVRAYQAGEPPPLRMGRELRGATLGVIGYGQISRYLCPLGAALGMRVLVSDPHAQVDDARFAQVAMESLLEQSDYVVCLAIAVEETENLMNDAAFARMRPGTFFINPSRGNLVDEAALRRALDSGHLAGCALDVGRAPDQMPSPELAAHPRVIATPHIGGLTPQAIEHQALETVEQARAILAGRLPTGAVNAQAASRLARPGR